MEQITDINVLKQYQLGNLLALHRFCTEKKINYSLAYGSLLGAIRHQGIIPWDDDIDVCLLRDEYNRLIQEFPAQFEGKYSLHSLERQKDYVRPYARLCNDTTLETFQDNVPMPPMGIGIDIFPIDEVPEDEKEWQKFNKKRRRLVWLYMKKAYVHWDKKQNLLHNLCAATFNGVMRIVSFRTLAEKISHITQSYHGTGSQYLFEACQGLVTQQRIPSSAFATYEPRPFEGHNLRIITGYDTYLSLTYGNYMQLPPEEKRITHHHSTAYTKDIPS